MLSEMDMSLSEFLFNLPHVLLMALDDALRAAQLTLIGDLPENTRPLGVRLEFSLELL